MSDAVGTPASPAPVDNGGDTGGEGQEQQEEQQTEKKPAPAPKKEKRFLTAKSEDGKEERIDEETLLSTYQKWKSSEKRLAEVTQKEQSINAFMQRLQEDPESVINDPRLPIDRRKMAMKWLQEQVKEELQFADPKDKKLHDYEQELKAIREKEAEAAQKTKAEAEKKEREAIVMERTKHFENTFGKAMELSPLAKDPETAPETLRAMALEYRLAKSRGYTPTPEELAQKVENKYFKSMYSAAGHLTGDDLIAFLGNDIVNKIRLYDLGQLEKKRSAPPAETAQNWESSQGSKTSAYVDPYELIKASRSK